mgnify:CR=1 FL=1|jgi:hypothetical protein
MAARHLITRRILIPVPPGPGDRGDREGRGDCDAHEDDKIRTGRSGELLSRRKISLDHTNP